MACTIAISPPMPTIVIMAIAEMANQVREELWPALDWASWIFHRAGFVLIASLVIGVIATGLIVWMGIVKEHHWDLARELSAKKIAELNNQTERLKAENLVLQKELIATQHVLADRYIWPNDQPAIREALSKFPGQVVRMWVYPASSPDTFTLGMMVAGVMHSSNWQVTLWDMHTATPIPGISVLYRKGVTDAKEAAETLVSQLGKIKAGMVVGPTAMEADEPIGTPPAPATVAWTTSKEIPDEETIRVFVGGKENPFR